MATLTAAHVIVVAGKGGVGKTTVTAVTARAAAAAGQRVLVVELDGKPTLGDALADTPGVEVRHISPAAALEEYLVEHGFGRIARRLAASGVIDVISAAAPGIDDLVVLGKVKQLERSGSYDTILVDGPAAGHAVTMLTSPAGLLAAVRGGPVHQQANEVVAMLRDPERCRVVLVTVAEHTPVNELIETALTIEDRAGVQLAAVVVNEVDNGPPVPDPAGIGLVGPDEAVRAAREAATFVRARRAEQQAELRRVADAVPLPLVVVPAGPLDTLAGALT